VSREKKPINPDAEVRAPRRHAGGARREASERVVVRASSPSTGAFETHGWTLNVSRGGIRAIVEDPLVQGMEYQLLVGGGGSADGDEETAVVRRATVVWLQDEADGQIVGLKYLDVEDGSDPPKDG
jgi:hypothetical protein